MALTAGSDVMTARREPERRRYLLRLECKGDVGTHVRALRWLLQTLLRAHGPRCVEAREENDGQQERSS
jgi:hypothetical protein